MPQMAPIWWTLMMILFIFTLFMMMTLIYFNNMNKYTKMKKIFTSQMNWKW
uniref:ATP synthase complex subunit 8 n=1 Tax=Cuerna sp. EMHAU-2015-Zz052311 TaxID=2036853 RepID=A0A343K1E1_9HEMI|nr:ATP synthase F0 subunit 8 [Cuerna sp. EMHAU-2015-Zz052311]